MRFTTTTVATTSTTTTTATTTEAATTSTQLVIDSGFLNQYRIKARHWTDPAQYLNRCAQTWTGKNSITSRNQIEFKRCKGGRRWAAHWKYDETTYQIRSTSKRDRFYCWSADFNKCTDFEFGCSAALKIKRCNTADETQNFKWDRTSGRIEMVHAVNRCLTFNKYKWKYGLVLKTCTGYLPGDRLSAGHYGLVDRRMARSMHASKLQAWGYNVDGVYQLESAKPGSLLGVRQIETHRPL